jgi:hypothetical protein
LIDELPISIPTTLFGLDDVVGVVEKRFAILNIPL